MRSASSWSSVTRPPSRSAAPPTRPPGRERSPRAATSSSSSSNNNSPCPAWTIKSPALWTCSTSRTHPVSVDPPNIHRAPQPANATRTKTVMLSVAGEATTLKAGRWPGLANARCAGAATLNASSAHRERRSTPARGKRGTVQPFQSEEGGCVEEEHFFFSCRVLLSVSEQHSASKKGASQEAISTLRDFCGLGFRGPAE